jgi:hypothetical protein
MRFKLVSTVVVAAIVAAAVFAAVSAKPVTGSPSKEQACVACHPAAPAGTSVSATPSTSTPAPGATYSVTISLAGLTTTGDTGYWISNNAGTPAVSVFAGNAGTSQTTYTRDMTAPSSPGTYSYTVWCDRGGLDNGQAKSTTYGITVEAPPAPVAAITSLTPNHAQTGTSIVIAGTDLGTAGTVRFGTTAATTGSWSATSVTATVPASLAPGSVNVTVTPTGAAASNALSFTVDAPPSGGDTTAPVTTASGPRASGWYNRTVNIGLSAVDELGGSGVAAITSSIDGGAPSGIAGAAATVTLAVDAVTHLNDGSHSIAYHATDVAGNAESGHALAVNIDTRKPTTKAPSAARVKRYRVATLKYEVDDVAPNSGTARVVITIKNRSGKVVKTLKLGVKPVNTALKATFRCKLLPGTYRFSVKATDGAGNRQSTIATRTLTVYPAA